MKLISEELLDGVTRAAQENSRLRMNYNFHESLDAPIHRLLNALEPGTYLPPHRHSDKEETYVVLRGSLWTFFYDDSGNVTEKVCLNPAAGTYGVEIPAGTWHSIVVLETGTVIFEIYRRILEYTDQSRYLINQFFSSSKFISIVKAHIRQMSLKFVIFQKLL